MKVAGHGQAEPLNRELYMLIREGFRSENHKLLFDIAWHTGERWGAILQLQIPDIYQDASKRLLRNCITFRAVTRKDKATRQVPIHPALALRLRTYPIPKNGWLFPSDVVDGGHLSTRAADRALRRALARVGLENAGISTHSTRRGFITTLHRKGTSVRVIQALTGHKSLAVLAQYIEVTDEQRQAAIALL